MSTETATAQESAQAGASQTDLDSAVKEFSDIKLVVLESAELANRSANMATNAGADLKTATKDIHSAIRRQNVKFYVLLVLAASLMLLGAVVLGTMSFTLKTRINQFDEMLASMSMRVGELNQGLEVVGSVNEGFQEMVAKQAGIAAAQARIEVRMNEIIMGTQGISEQTAKQVEAKNQALTKQVQALESRLQSQTQTLNAMSGQMQGLRSSAGDTGALKRQLETLTKQQKERQAQEAKLQAQAQAEAQQRRARAEAEAQAQQKKAEEAAAADTRKREVLVRYPRVGNEAVPTPGSGVLSTKP
ncbi:MAG: hypothetical protein ACO24Y_05815 [Hylemonella sp.]